jgi:hypothetical protein
MADTGIPARYADGRNEGHSAMARASADRPFKPYVYRGGETEPPAVTAARERARAFQARTAQAAAALAARLDTLAGLDAGPGPEWYRERDAEDADDMRGQEPAASMPPVRVPPLSLALVPDDGELAELEAARDRYHAAHDALNAPPEPPAAAVQPPAPARRHRACGYLMTSAGHRAVCGG